MNCIYMYESGQSIYSGVGNLISNGQAVFCLLALSIFRVAGRAVVEIQRDIEKANLFSNFSRASEREHACP